MSDQIDTTRELRDAFIQHLPDRITKIHQHWKGLSEGGWNSEKLQQLFSRIQDLSDACGRFGLIELSEKVFALETYLSSFVDSVETPKPEHYSRISELVESLSRQEQESPSQGPSGVVQSSGKTVFYIRATAELVPHLVDSLENEGFEVLTFVTPDDAEGQVKSRTPSLIIIEGTFTRQMAGLNRELSLLQEQGNKKTPMICLSTSRDLEHRLIALRSGIDEYMLSPFNLPEIVNKAVDLTLPPQKKYRVLVVEDDPTQAKFASSILEKSGMLAKSVTEPLKVLEALDIFRPDLILMDLYMPHANGTELTTIIREHDEFVATPIVFLSGEQDADKKLRALSFGGDDFLSKPIRPKHLIATITNRIERAHALRSGTGPSHTRDSLSGLYKRRHFFERLDGLLAEAGSGNIAGGMLLLQVENREVPDAGVNESLIPELSRLISKSVESQDLLSRLDSDLYGLIAFRPLESDLIQLADTIRGQIKAKKFMGEATLDAVIGICPFHDAPGDASGMVSRATKACSVARESDTESVIVYSPDLAAHTTDQGPDHLSEIVRNAVEQGNFQVTFQPLGDASNKGAENYEMRLRLNSREGDRIGEEQWRRAGLDARLLDTLDRRLAETAIGTLETKRNEGRQIGLFIEQSANSVNNQENIEWIKQQLRARQVVGTGLVFEFRIGDLSQELKAAASYIRLVRETGIGFCLSQFNGGASALKVLNYLEPEFVRISPQAMEMDPKDIDELVQEVRKSGTRIVLPRLTEHDLLPENWKSNGDLLPLAIGS